MKKSFTKTASTSFLNLLLGACLLLISSIGIKAQNCKPDKSVNDKFTRQKYDLYNYDLKGTWNMLTNTSTTTTFSFVVVADTQLVAALTFTQSASKNQRELNPVKISKGAELYFANDAASVKLICSKDAISKNKTNIISGNIDQTLSVEYEFPITDLETFSLQIFEQALINIDGAPGQKANIKKKEAAKMQEDAQCLLTKFKKP